MKMYKLFVTGVTKQISPHGFLFIPKYQIIVQRSMRLCSFCSFYHGKISKFTKHDQLRAGSTTTNTIKLTSLKSNMKRKTKKCTKLLTVTNEETHNEKIEVQNLTMSNLSVIEKNPDIADNFYDNESPIIDINLDTQYVDSNCHSFFNKEIYLNIDKNVDVIPTGEVQKFCANEKSFNNLINSNSVESNTSIEGEADLKNVSKKNVLHRKESRRLRKLYDPKYFIEYLLPYMQIYLNCGFLTKANTIFMKYRQYLLPKNTDKHSIELYNLFLRVYSFRREIGKVLEIYDMIKQDLVVPTPQTYVYILDVIGREIENNKKIVLLKEFTREMKNFDISFDDIFTKSYLKNDEKENILQLIHLLEPKFKPSYTELEVNYNCNLLKKLKMESNCESVVKDLFTTEELKKLFEIQFQREHNIQIRIPSIIIIEEDKNITSKSIAKVEEMENYWKKTALAAFERNLNCLKQKEQQSHYSSIILHPFLEVLDKECYIDAILKEIRYIVRGSESYSSSMKGLYKNLGNYIFQKYQDKLKKDNGMLDNKIKTYLQYLEWYLHPENMTHLKNMNNRTTWQYYENKRMPCIPLHVIPLSWSTDIVVDIGKFLYNIILNDIILQPEYSKEQNLKYSIPAFYTLFRNSGTYLLEHIKAHPLVLKLYETMCMKYLTFDVVTLPSCSPPCPWTSIYSGGYFLRQENLIRIPDYSEVQWCRIKETSPTQITPILDSLNQLSSVPWKVNTVILDIIIKIFQDGGSVELNVPQSVSALPQPPAINKNATMKERLELGKEWIQYKQLKSDTYSLWCDTLYKLSVANYFRNSIFWLAHNLDFRGRAYPVASHLSHLSSDLARSLLLFAKGKPLGPNGLDWLKIHVINLTSFKKGCSHEERLKYANENIENILDSAEKPLTGKMWWAKSEEPWQTLAGCMEIANALKAPKVEEYICTFPVHQDGSCNGLQHYAALGRDQIGAQSVNLNPSDSPKDVYMTVAEIIEKQRKIDANNNNEMAAVLQGFVKRKVIKQTVMTTVYGVTKYGAKLQIAKQLKDTDNFPEKYIWHASIYLTENTFNSLRTMFKSAREIQDWLTGCARIISCIFRENVEWVTPIGFPVVQPYIKQIVNKKISKQVQKLDTMKQRNAFAPNFVHSLDATHMMLTSLNCNKQGVTFVSVHDCFWTHPCTVDIMNRICREQFVTLHSEPILENLATFFETHYIQTHQKELSKHQYGEKMKKYVINVPSKGTFDINNVLSSTYFFN